MASAISNTNSIHIGNHSEWIITLTCSCMNKVPLSCSPLLPAPEVVSDIIVVVIDCIMSHPFDIFGAIVLPLQNIRPSIYFQAYKWRPDYIKITRHLKYLEKCIPWVCFIWARKVLSISAFIVGESVTSIFYCINI